MNDDLNVVAGNLETWIAATNLAEEFDRWLNLDQRLAQDPAAVPPEQISEAWSQVLEAHERWALTR